jgi:hypothetical protein
MVDASIQTLVEDVEKELLDVIVQNLKQQRMTDDQAQQWAQEFLLLLPIQDKKDLLQKLNSFSKAHADTKGIYLKYAKPYEEEERHRKLTLMSEHIKKGEIEHALRVAKGEPANA